MPAPTPLCQKAHFAICLAARRSGELTSPGSRPQPMTDGSRHINTQLPLHGWDYSWVSVFSAGSLSSRGGLCSSYPQPWPPWSHTLLGSFHFLTPCSAPLLVANHFQISYLSLVSGFKVCFWGNPNKMPNPQNLWNLSFLASSEDYTTWKQTCQFLVHSTMVFQNKTKVNR